jgi:hypothetical protein
MLSRALPICSLLLAALALDACTIQPTAIISAPLQPQPGAPVAYLVGALGPVGGNQWQEERLMLRKRGTEQNAIGHWMKRGIDATPADIQDGSTGRASVFVLPLKPGDYEIYSFLFTGIGTYPGLGTVVRTWQPKEQFNLPVRLQAGKAYYLGEFRSSCVAPSACSLRWQNQLLRDQAIAQRQVPGLAALQPVSMNFDNARPFIFPAAPVQP